MLEDFDHAVPFDVTNRGVGAGAVWSIRDLVIGFVSVFVLFFIFATAIVYPVVEATHEDSTEALAAQAIAVASGNIYGAFGNVHARFWLFSCLGETFFAY